MSTHNIQICNEIRKISLICFLELTKEFCRELKRVRIIHNGKRAIGVRVIEILLYIRRKRLCCTFFSKQDKQQRDKKVSDFTMLMDWDSNTNKYVRATTTRSAYLSAQYDHVILSW